MQEKVGSHRIFGRVTRHNPSDSVYEGSIGDRGQGVANRGQWYRPLIRAWMLCNLNIVHHFLLTNTGGSLPRAV